MIVLIPSFEPTERLAHVVSQLHGQASVTTILIVDDGSGPAFAGIFSRARQLGATVIGYQVNAGKGHALKFGFGWIATHLPHQVIVCADSDGQHAPADVMRVAAEAEIHPDRLILGVRQVTHSGPVSTSMDGAALPTVDDSHGEQHAGAPIPWRSRFGNSLTRLMFRGATGTDVSDTQTGLRAFDMNALPWLCNIAGERFEYELNVLLEATQAGWVLAEVPITTIYEPSNPSSHFRPLRDSGRIYRPLLGHLLRHRLRRVTGFTASGLLSFCLDFALVIVLQALGSGLLLSVVVARLVSATVNFSINRKLVFAHHGRDAGLGRSAGGYFCLAGCLLGANYALMWLGTQAMGISLVVTKLLTELVLFGVSYLVQRHKVFAAPPAGVAASGTPDRGSATEPPRAPTDAVQERGQLRIRA